MAAADLLSDPFGERERLVVRQPLALLGARIRFESNDRRLLKLADEAFAGLPPHRLPSPRKGSAAPELRIVLRVTARSRARGRSEPPLTLMHSGAGLLAGAPETSSFVSLSPETGSALVVVPEAMLRFPYHTRYGLIEFAVYTLAGPHATARRATCRLRRYGRPRCAADGRERRGEIDRRPALSPARARVLCRRTPSSCSRRTPLATGAANFLHVRSDSLRWLGRTRAAATIRRSPVIRRRSGMHKFEVDLRRGGFKLARAPLELVSIVFLSARAARGGPLLTPLGRADLLARLESAQAYAAGQPEWPAFRARSRGARCVRAVPRPRPGRVGRRARAVAQRRGADVTPRATCPSAPSRSARSRSRASLRRCFP